MPHNQRMDSAWSLCVGIALFEPLTQLTRGVTRCVVLARERLNPRLECLRKRRVGLVEIVEERLAAG